MAYVLPQLDDEEEKQQQQSQSPSLGGQQMIGGGGGGPMSAPKETPKAQNVTQKGTGFTNLSNWLDAGKGRDQDISSKGSSLLGEEKTAFGAAKKPLEDATFSAKTIEGMGRDPATGTLVFDRAFGNAANGDQKAKGEIKGMLEQDYTGPMSVDYNAADRKNLWDVGALTDASTASSVLAKPQMDAGKYGAGMQRLDSVLFGADAASRGALDKNKTDFGDFTKQVGADSEALAKKALGFKDQAKQAREGVRDELTKRHGTMTKQLDDEVKRLQDEEAKDAAARAQGLVYDPSSSSYVKMGQSLSAGKTTGGGATRENVVTATQKSGFDLLNELLGTPSVTKGNTSYEKPRTEIVRDPNWQPHSKIVGNPRVGTVLQMLPGDQADPNSPKGMYMRAWAEAGYPGADASGNYDAIEANEFLDSFARAHPELRIPTQEETDAYEKGGG
jgi:hypothetical protein